METTKEITRDWDSFEGKLVHITFLEPVWEKCPSGLRSIRGKFGFKLDDFVCIKTMSRWMMINIRIIVNIQEEQQNYKTEGY